MATTPTPPPPPPLDRFTDPRELRDRLYPSTLGGHVAEQLGIPPSRVGVHRMDCRYRADLDAMSVVVELRVFNEDPF